MRVSDAPPTMKTPYTVKISSRCAGRALLFTQDLFKLALHLADFVKPEPTCATSY